MPEDRYTVVEPPHDYVVSGEPDDYTVDEESDRIEVREVTTLSLSGGDELDVLIYESPGPQSQATSRVYRQCWPQMHRSDNLFTRCRVHRHPT
jgi:hypothetical protein